MAEVIGVVASVISIVGVAKTCIDVYALVDDCKHASKDQRRLVSQLKEQRLRFFLWCDYVGITEILHLQQLESTAASAPDIESVAISRLTPQLRRAFVCKEILSILQRITELFQESSELLKKYTNQKPKSAVTSLVKFTSHNNIWFGMAESISASEGRHRGASKAPKSSMSMWQSGRWTTIDKRKLTELVDQLRLANDGLQSILGMVEMNQIRRRTELLATTTPFASVVATAHSIEDVNPVRPGPRATIESGSQDSLQLINDNRDLRQLVELYRRGFAIDQDLDSDRLESSIVPDTPLPIPSFFADEYHLLSSDIVLPDSIERSPQHRLYTFYKSKPVIVEWKYYSANIGPPLLTMLKKRVSMLASQLQQSSQTSGFHTLSCIGYFDNAPMHRIGIVFEYAGSKVSSRPLSLRDRMAQDRSDKNVRDLTSRLLVAKALVMAIYRLHSVGWLHKSIRSDNILFFEEQGLDRHTLAAPFVCGFDFSRQDSPLEMTEDIPTILISRYMDRERSLYRHPDLDIRTSLLPYGDEDQESLEALSLEDKENTSNDRYRKAYDVYSLGIILLEIGLWCPVKDLCGKNDSVKDFRQKLQTKLLPELRYRTGKIYFEIVQRCLDGDMGQDKASVVTAINDDESEVRDLHETRIWLSGFDKYIVSELEKCNV